MRDNNHTTLCNNKDNNYNTFTSNDTIIPIFTDEDEECKSCVSAISQSNFSLKRSSPHKVHYSLMLKKFTHLRVWVLGAIDGLISVSSILMGIGGAGIQGNRLLLAGIAAWIGGALSMACGEFLFQYSRFDLEKADLEAEQFELEHAAEEELNELTMIYIQRGLSRNLARQVAEELTAKDALKAHARDELGIDLGELDAQNPYSSAFSSALAFIVGGFAPVLACGISMYWDDMHLRLMIISAMTSFIMLIFGMIGGLLAGAGICLGGMRVMCGGLVTMGITFGVARIVMSSGV